MKITAINVHNFLGVRAVEARLAKPVTIFAGPNHSGKSSLQEAIRMALTGESVRVSLKKDYALLVNDTEKSGFAEIEVDGSAHAFITLPDGKTAPASDYVMAPALPYILDAQRFASLAPDERRTFLFGLMGLSADGQEVKARLLAKHCEPGMVDLILPLMRSGFDAAHKEAQNRAREAKGEWKATTGETYGEKKAETWRPETVQAFDPAELVTLQDRMEATDAGLDAANQRLGMLNAERKRHAEAAGKIGAIKELADRQPRIAEKLAHDQVDLNGWIEKVAATRSAAGEAFEDLLVCPGCNAGLHLVDGQLGHASPREHDPEAAAKLPEYEKALALMQKAVDNGRRDLAEATAAKELLADLPEAEAAFTDVEITAGRAHLDDLKAQRSTLTAQAAELVAAKREIELQAGQQAKAKAAHQSVLAWSRIADALAPDGIPGEILAAALEPLNERLFESSTDADWLRPCVAPDMSIGAAYPMQSERPYALLSESERWRVDAMLAEAVSHLSGLGVVCLDRADCLDLQGRADLLAWLDGLVEDKEIETALIFATLKSPPANLPESIGTVWIEGGVIKEALCLAAA